MSTETVIGVVFSVALAAGALLSTGDELIEALFGRSGSFTVVETLVGIAVAAVVVTFVLRQRHRLVFALVSPEIAQTARVDVARLNLRFLRCSHIPTLPRNAACQCARDPWVIRCERRCLVTYLNRSLFSVSRGHALFGAHQHEVPGRDATEEGMNGPLGIAGARVSRLRQ